MRTRSFLPRLVTVCKSFGLGMLLFVASSFVIGSGSLPVRQDVCKSLGYKKTEPYGKLFLITVIDSNDDTIGIRCEKDREEITYIFEDIADWLGMEMAEPKVISGDEFSKAAVNDAIDSWLSDQHPSPADVVVFYYSGHGFRYPDDKSEYPRMWLKTSEDRNTETASLSMEEDIFNRIVTMGAGVNLVLSDCCNTSVAGDNALFDQAKVQTRKRTTRKRARSADQDRDEGLDNAEKLLTPKQPLSIIATAAGKGEFAGGKPETGGFFTNYLIEALSDCIFENKLAADWESIFQYADKNAGYWAKSGACPQAKHNAQGRCLQNAQYKVLKGE
ncbi:MAG: caspase family protein [Bacteroidota bacterium]